MVLFSHRFHIWERGELFVQKTVWTKLLRCIKHNLLKKLDYADSIEPKFLNPRFLDPEKFNI